MGKILGHIWIDRASTNVLSVSTQRLLACLRDEVGHLSNLHPGTSLEDIFDGSMICHMDHSIPSDTNAGISISGVPIVIKYLATTQKAYSRAKASSLEYPPPSLDEFQMDIFVDIQSPLPELKGLNSTEVGHLKTRSPSTET